MPLDIEDASKLPHEFVVFYSWQSQLPRKTNYTFIANSLRNAISKIESELPSSSHCSITIDRDTSGRSGSPDIANTILGKVSRCQLFVGDVSVVLSAADRAYCNSNVLIELGYAAGALDWSRVTCVCNTEFGDVDTLPFDIRGRRVSRYRLAPSGDEKSAASQLDRALYLAIASRLESIARGEGELEEGGMAALKRQRDLHVLRNVLRNIHRPTFDRFFHYLDEYNFLGDFHYFWDGLAAAVNSNRFQFYDKNLTNLTLGFCKPLGEGVADGASVFGPGRNPDFFVLRRSINPLLDDKERVDSVMKHLFVARDRLQEFLDYVHDDYPEIDLAETDRQAWEENEPYINGTILESRVCRDETDGSGEEGEA